MTHKNHNHYQNNPITLYIYIYTVYVLYIYCIYTVYLYMGYSWIIRHFYMLSNGTWQVQFDGFPAINLFTA